MTRSDHLATIPALETHGRRALARLGARMAAIYVAGTAIGLTAAAGGGTRPWWGGLPAAIGVLVLGLLLCICLERIVPPPTARWAVAPVWPGVVVIAAGLGILAVIVASGPLVGWPAAQVLVGWVVPGAGLGLALAAGPHWGIVALVVLGGGFAVVAPDEAAAAVPATLGGAAVTVVVGAVISVAARRGFATTEAAVRAADAAQAARERAEQRFLAQRRRDRLLHDTVLSTLTVLAHGGRGIAPEQVRADCRRDLAALRTDRWEAVLAGRASADPDPGAALEPGAGAAPDPGAAPDLDPALTGRGMSRLPRQVTPIAARLDAVRELAARSGIDLRVHVQAQDRPFRGGTDDAVALEAWSNALAECVTNITRHAGVSAADVVLGRTDTSLVTLVVDEGSGFEPGEVRPERLGLSGSVHERLHDVGGQARVWSRPGEGTVVELVLPWPRRTEGAP